MKTGKEKKVRLLRRILVSYNDFKQAADIASYILGAKLHRDYPEKDRHIVFDVLRSALGQLPK